MGTDLTVLYGAGASAALTRAAIEAAKRLGHLPGEWAFAAALVVATGINLLVGVGLLHRPWPEAVMYGLMAGLTASGSYSGLKSLAESATAKGEARLAETAQARFLERAQAAEAARSLARAPADGSSHPFGPPPASKPPTGPTPP